MGGWGGGLCLQSHVKDCTLQTTHTRTDGALHGATYPRPRAVLLGVPLLAVEAHLEALTQEETRPHDDVEHGALQLVVHGEVEHHCERAREGREGSEGGRYMAEDVFTTADYECHCCDGKLLSDTPEER